MVIVVMGVSGAGKTTLGRALARRLGWPFHEGDDLHAGESVRKMARGEPLTDADRRPWLEGLGHLAGRAAAEERNAVVTCSCLRRAYRDLVRAAGGVRFVYLAIEPEAAARRVGGRRGHFFDERLVPSQFEILEPPRRAVRLDATRPVEELVREAVARLGIATSSPNDPRA